MRVSPVPTSMPTPPETPKSNDRVVEVRVPAIVAARGQDWRLVPRSRGTLAGVTSGSISSP